MNWLRKIIESCKDDRGFTLLELMVVAVIIGILAAVAIPNYMNNAEKAKVKAAQAELKTIATGLELYYVEEGEYPAAGENNLVSEIDDDLEDYIGKNVPTMDPWGNGYNYEKSDDEYSLYALHDVDGDGDDDKIFFDEVEYTAGP